MQMGKVKPGSQMSTDGEPKALVTSSPIIPLYLETHRTHSINGPKFHLTIVQFARRGYNKAYNQTISYSLMASLNFT